MPLSLAKGVWVPGASGDDMGEVAATWADDVLECDAVLILPYETSDGLISPTQPVTVTIGLNGVTSFGTLPGVFRWNRPQIFTLDLPYVQVGFDGTFAPQFSASRLGFVAVPFNTREGLPVVNEAFGIRFNAVTVQVKP